jgi:hypothetical protein
LILEGPDRPRSDLDRLDDVIQAMVTWDGDASMLEPIAWAVDGLAYRSLAPRKEEAGAWLRFEGTLLAVLARLDLGDPDGRLYYRRLSGARERLLDRGRKRRIP